MAETTYNITIPHTAPNIYYDDFSTECPDTDSNGFPVCDDAKGFHVAANSTARMRLEFVGSAIYIYGSADEGMEYTWSLNYGTKTNGKPNGNLLIAAENLKLESYRNHFTLEIILTQFKSAARFQFNKADVIVGTGMTGAQTFVDSYKAGNEAVRLMTGWIANDTIPGYQYYQSNTSSPLVALLDFQGAAVWVWGLCGHRGRLGSNYGSVSVDNGSKDYITTLSSRGATVDHKCLVYWQSGLDVTQPHNITYNSESNLVLLESFEVLRVEGGTRISTTGNSSPTSTTRTSSPTSNSSLTNSTGILTGAIIGGVVGGLALLFAVVRIIRAIQRKQKQEQEVLAAVYGQVPAFAPVPVQPKLFPTPPAPPAAYYNQPVATPHPSVATSVAASHPSDYYSAPVTTPAASTQQLPDERTAEEVNRLRQEMAAMRTAMYGQQQHQSNLLIHGQDDEYAPPPEYQLTAPSGSRSSWQPPPGPLPDNPPATPRGKAGS